MSAPEPSGTQKATSKMSTNSQKLGQQLRRLYGRRYRVRKGTVEQCYWDGDARKWKWTWLTSADESPMMFSLLGVRHLSK